MAKHASNSEEGGAQAPQSVTPQYVVVSDEDKMFDDLNAQSLEVNATPAGTMNRLRLPDACLRYIGGSRQMNASGRIVEIPMELSDGSTIPYIEDDNKARHYKTLPKNDPQWNSGLIFPVTRDNHPKLKKHETNAKGRVVRFNCLLGWMTRATYKRLHAEDTAYFNDKSGMLADSGPMPVPGADEGTKRSRVRGYIDHEDRERSAEEKDPQRGPTALTPNSLPPDIAPRD